MKKIKRLAVLSLILVGCTEECTNDVRVFQVTSKGDVELFVGKNVTMDCDVALPFTQTIDGITWRYQLK
jgi:hypothetical protein